MSKRKKTEYSPMDLNKMAYERYVEILRGLAISVVEWVNLPPTVDARFLELSLYKYGQVAFFKDEVIGFLALPAILNSPFDVYGVPLAFEAYSPYNQYRNNLTNENAVLIFNNLSHLPSIHTAQLYAQRLGSIERSIDVNVNAQKTPIFIQCDETELLTMKNIYEQYDGNAPVIFGRKGLAKDYITVLNTQAPYVGDKLFDLKDKVWNEALTYLGISNTVVTKKERLITDEVNRSQGGVLASRYSRMAAREQACEKINQMFGLNISCRFREEIDIKEPEVPYE